MDLPETERDAIEVAALLHDVGLIGAPDRILLKPSALDADEAALMSRTRRMSLEILRRSCTSPQVLRSSSTLRLGTTAAGSLENKAGTVILNAARVESHLVASSALRMTDVKARKWFFRPPLVGRPGYSPGLTDDRHRRGLRRHDHRSRLSAGLARGSGRFRNCSTVPARSSTRNWSSSSRSSARKTRR